jgi:branched-chain amino acid transport system substrate-binding protein
MDRGISPTRNAQQADALDRRDFLTLASGAGLALALALRSSPSAAADPVLKIGCLGPFTGPSSRVGQNIRQGIEMAIADARQAGELPLTIGGQKRDIGLVWVDSQSDPEQAVKALRAAIDREGISLVLSGWHSSVAMALMDVEADAKLVHVGDVGESQFIAEKMLKDPDRYRGYFKSYPSPASQSTLYGAPLNYFRDKGMWKPANLKAAVLVEDTDYGRGWGESLVAGLKGAGYEVMPYDVTSLTETDYAPLLTKYKASKASLVVITTSGSVGFANFVKQFRQQKLKALLIAHGLTWSSEWRQLTGEASDFAIAMDSPAAIADWQFEWQRRFKQKYGEDPSITSSGLAYDYTRLALSAVQKAGGTDRDKLAATIRDTPYKGVWNYYAFADKAGANAVSQNEVMTGEFMKGFFFPMTQIQNGKVNIIWPLDYAKASFTAPPWL